MIKQTGSVVHSTGKKVPILRDFSLQVKLVQSALLRGRKNALRQPKTDASLPVNNSNSDFVSDVPAAESISVGEAPESEQYLFTYSDPGRSVASYADLVDLSNRAIKALIENPDGTVTIRKSSAVGITEHLLEFLKGDDGSQHGFCSTGKVLIKGSSGGPSELIAQRELVEYTPGSFPEIEAALERSRIGLCIEDGVGGESESVVCGDGGDGGDGD